MRNSHQPAPMAAASGRARSRWTVHLALLITITVALVPLLLFHVSLRVTVHVVIACVFLGLVIVHLAQRRHTLRRLIAQLASVGSRAKGRRLAISSAIFAFLVANVLASGIVDLATGQIPASRYLASVFSSGGILFRACSSWPTSSRTSFAAGSDYDGRRSADPGTD